MFQINQLSSVSVHLQLNLVEHEVGQDVSSALPNRISILFIFMQITTLAIHNLALLVDLHTELQLCINDALIQYWQTNCATNELKLLYYI